MGADAYATAKKLYCTRMHTTSIPMEDEPTDEQLSLLRLINSEGAPPYVDFAVWGPHGGRVKKALAHTGFAFDAWMKLVHQELRGAPSIE